MAYGTANTVMELVWGSVKANVPSGVTSALISATDIINSKLNIKVELTGDDLPTQFDSIANQLAAGMLQEQRDPKIKSQRTLTGESLLKDYMDDSNSTSRGESYHMRIVEP